MPASLRNNPGFGIYVHWPFCLAKCPYCDFNSHVRHGGPDEARFRAALIAEIAWFAQETEGQTVDTVFFGGGTPSLMDPETVAAVLGAIAAHWPMRDSVEITLEANPTSVEAGRFRGFRQAGVNRVSLGVQALDDCALKRLGRQHTAQEALDAFAVARDNFDRVSFDLIYARPGQSVEQWCKELSTALGHVLDHVSLYQLTIEPGTAFFDLRERGKLKIPADDLAADLYEATTQICDEHGLGAYEISNHAAPGAECRHNLIYWRGGQWAGVGPGAHSRLGDPVTGPREALQTQKHPENWATQVETAGHGIVERTTISQSQSADELLLMGMRLTEGVDVTRFTALGGTIDTVRCAELADQGLVCWDQGAGVLALTASGRLLANTVIAQVAQ
ncbi:MAG: radical SAM family heme chaperone HemW [Alphaproteobacteria bacterium]